MESIKLLFLFRYVISRVGSGALTNMPKIDHPTAACAPQKSTNAATLGDSGDPPQFLNFPCQRITSDLVKA